MDRQPPIGGVAPRDAKAPARTGTRTRNVRLSRGRTSVRLAPQEWQALHVICEREGIDRHIFAARAMTDPRRSEHTLTSRMRGAILAYFIAAAGITLPD